MNKSELHENILQVLTALCRVANKAAMDAYNTATDDENVAENKYDTLGLEASYLAQGQAQRVAECEADLAVFRQLEPRLFEREQPLAIGAVVELLDEEGARRYLFIGPAAGGLKLLHEQKEITIVTPSAPLGGALLGCRVEDEIEVGVGDRARRYEIVTIY